MRRLELKWLEDFLALAELGGFSRAAEARNVTQPAFGRRIRALEHWLGTSLVDRSSHPPELTSAGRRFRESAAELVRDMHRLRRDLRQEAGDAGDTVVVAAPHVLALSVVPNWLQGVKRSVPPFRLRLINDNVHDCIQDMIDGEADFLINFYHPQIPLVLDPRRFPYVTLGRERLLPFAQRTEAGAARHPLPGSAEAPLPYLTYGSGTFLERAIDLHLAQMPLAAHLAPFVENSIADCLKAMAADGQGIAWLPEAVVSADDLDQRLAPAGDESWNVSLGLRLYWASERGGRLSERVWQHMLQRVGGG